MGKWLKRLGILVVLAFPLSVLLYRLNMMSFGKAFQLMQATVVIGAVVFLVGLIYFIFAKKNNPEGAKAALVGAVIALIPVVPLLMQAKKARALPYIHNVSTDIVNAPQFDKVLALRTENDNPHVYDAEQAIGDAGKLGELQQGAYPNVKTHQSSLSVSEALIKAEAVAKEMGWEIVNVDAAQGIVEATETTLLWGFKDDIVIRVQQGNTSTNVDLHSVSRFGGSDIGANAARIEKFIQRFAG